MITLLIICRYPSLNRAIFAPHNNTISHLPWHLAASVVIDSNAKVKDSLPASIASIITDNTWFAGRSGSALMPIDSIITIKSMLSSQIGLINR